MVEKFTGDLQSRHGPGGDGAPDVIGAGERGLEGWRWRDSIVDPLDQASVLYDRDATVAGQAKVAGVCERTIRNWLRERKERGAEAGRRKERSDKGDMRGIDPRIAEAVPVLARDYCERNGVVFPVIAALHREIVKLFGPARSPRYQALKKFCGVTLNGHRLAFAALGARRFKGEMGLAMPGSRSGTVPGELNVADHSPGNLWVRPIEGGKRFRPDLTLMMDTCTGEIVAFCFSRQGNSQTIALCSRMAILPKSPHLDPEGLYRGKFRGLLSDLGRDFRSRHVYESHRRQGIHVYHTAGYNPQAKGKVERAARTCDQEFFSRYRGRTGNDPRNKPLAVPDDELVTLEELSRAFGEYAFLEFNHKKRRVRGKWVSPIELRRAAKLIPEMPADEDTLIDFMKSELRTLTKGGFSLHGIPFWDIALAPWVGEKVEVRYDPADMGQVLVLDTRENVICWAQNRDAVQARLSEEDLRRFQRENREYTKALKIANDEGRKAAQDIRFRMRDLAEKRTPPEPEQAEAVSAKIRRTVPVLPSKTARQLRRAGDRQAADPWDNFNRWRD